MTSATPTRFTGIHSMLFAMFDANETLNRDAMRDQVEHVIAVGCDGVCVLGLATEVQKLSSSERYQLVDWAAEDTLGKLPLGVTVAGNSVAEQSALARHAQAAGAGWIILQPPMVGSFTADEYIRFFGRVADSVDMPVAIQNAPAYLGRGLSAGDISQLIKQHPNITHLKGEESAVQIERIAQLVGGRMTLLNGRAGLELTDNLRAGCEGFILASDTADIGVQVFNDWRDQQFERAESRYQHGLPAVTFVMQSLEHLVTYGKRLYALRAGLGADAVYDRTPAMVPTPFGLQCVARWARHLGPL